jgi:hypothetical protein
MLAHGDSQPFACLWLTSGWLSKRESGSRRNHADRILGELPRIEHLLPRADDKLLSASCYCNVQVSLIHELWVENDARFSFQAFEKQRAADRALCERPAYLARLLSHRNGRF